MADAGWESTVKKYAPTAVVHTAWQIRAMYGNVKEQWRWNVEGSGRVFDFALSQNSVKKLVYFSTASSYGARSSNTVTHYFTEAEGFREDNYIYAKEKKVTNYFLVEALDVKQAYERIHQSLNNMLVTFDVPDIIKSSIMEVYEYISKEEREGAVPAGFKPLKDFEEN